MVLSRAYANKRGDYLVPFGTAAFQGADQDASASGAIVVDETIVFEKQGIRMEIVTVAAKDGPGGKTDQVKDEEKVRQLARWKRGKASWFR